MSELGINQKILTFALRAGLFYPEKVKLISKGIASETYQIFNENKRYIVTRFINESVSLQSILIMKLSRFFSKMQFPVPVILATGQIDKCETILTEHKWGKVKLEWSNDDYAQLGTLTANLHWTQRLFFHNQPTRSLPEMMQKMMQDTKDSLPESFKPLLDEIESLIYKWPSDVPKGLIHGDIWVKNIFFENDKISALLDFHLPYYDCIVYDLGAILKGIYFSKSAQDNDQKLNAFLTAYQKINPLSEREIELLPLMLRAKIIYTTLFMLTQATYNLPMRENYLSIAMFNYIKLKETKEITFEKSLV